MAFPPREFRQAARHDVETGLFLRESPGFFVQFRAADLSEIAKQT
jgi:hypothetical protein